MKRIPTICVYCGCGCGLYLDVEYGVVTGITPQRSHYVSRGTLCAKGWSLPELLRGYGRLANPCIKEGDKFKKITWESAFDEIVRRLKKLISKYGNDSIGIFS